MGGGCGEFLGFEGEAGLDLVRIDGITNLGPGLLGVGFLVVFLVDFLCEAAFNSLNGGQTCLKKWRPKIRILTSPFLGADFTVKLQRSNVVAAGAQRSSVPVWPKM